MPNDYEAVIEKLSESWAPPVVARSSISEFTGGALQPGTLANFDSKGIGPDGAFLMAGKIVYPKHELVRWLKDRSSPSWRDRKHKGICKRLGS